MSLGAFRERWDDLEARMKRLAEEDGDVFLPNPPPQGPVEHVFICMEPSLGRWGRSKEEAESKVAAGFLNFISSYEDFILHYAIRRFLSPDGESYHITDFSKGAMLTKRARNRRRDRYDRWYSLLLEELNLVRRGSGQVFAVGNAVEEHLTRRRFPLLFTKILHYSGQAARARNRAVAGEEEQFRSFVGAVTHESIVELAEQVLEEYRVPAEFRSDTLQRLKRANLSESRQKLLYVYKREFEQRRVARRTGVKPK